MQFNQGVYQTQRGLDPTAFKQPAEGTQGQYNPLELLQMLFKKKQQVPSMGQSFTPYQKPLQQGIDYPNYVQPIMPQGTLSPNGQIMPSILKGLLG